MNTKPGRGNARCQLITLDDQRYGLERFAALLPTMPVETRHTRVSYANGTRPGNKVLLTDSDALLGKRLNPRLVRAVSLAFVRRGYRRAGDWLCGSCLTPARHRHGDQHSSFGFSTRTGYAYCHVCGVFLLKDLCRLLHVRSSAYGGLLEPEDTRDEERTASIPDYHPDPAPQ